MDPRIPPSGPFAPIARLSISAPIAFSDGVDDSIDFDVVDYIKGDIGTLVDPSVSGISFAVGPGLYLVQAQIVVDTAVTLDVSLDIQTGSGANVSENKNASATRLSTTLNAIVRATDTPFNADIFAGLICGFRGTGDDGNITSAVALIQRLGSP